ncbi:MAG TPA: hypothetical protein VKF81_14015 [Blastocatellia bacterium]|nr:hypothetical protein [Blastocatellia bacterium]
MSRLDDELRDAFRREQPPADFLARVLDRAALQPEPRPSWWRRLAMLLGTPRLRWVAIGVTASLLLAISATQFSRLHNASIDDRGRAAVTPRHSEDSSETAVDPKRGKPRIEEPLAPASKELKPHSTSASRRKARAHDDRAQVAIAEAQAAKEKLMLALYIASATLNDAEKAVHDDGPKP